MSEHKHACGQVVSYRLVLDDYGTPAILAWCDRCNAYTNVGKIDPADVPANVIAQLVATAGHDRHKPS